MPQIKPFKGLFFNKQKVKISENVTPPYDVISPREQEEFYKASPYNIVRLILGKESPDDNNENNKYARAQQYLAEWINNEVLIRDNEDSIYYLEEKFKVNDSEKIRKGFISLTKLEDFNQGNILPHEKTMLGPKADRLNLTKACKCNFSQIFSVYSDETSDTLDIFTNYKNQKPLIDMTYDNKNYKRWKIVNIADIKRLQNLMLDKKIFIADGHHRYETALAYRNYRREIDNNPDVDKPYDYVMMYFSPIENNDLLILPTHRGVKDVHLENREFLLSIANFFHFTEYSKKDLPELLKKLESEQNYYTVYLFYSGDEKLYYLKFDNSIKKELNDMDSLDVQILQNFILEKYFGITQQDLDNKSKIEYIKDIDYGMNLVDKGILKALFILNPTKIEQVKSIALSGKKMPQKSTYFYPKLITGLVINKIE